MVFLLGFIPQFRNANRLQGEVSLRDQRIERLQREAALSKARDLASLLHVELARRNYGVAEKHATAFFNHIRSIMSDASFLPLKGNFGDILGQRDAMISSISKSDPAAETSASEMPLRTHQLALPYQAGLFC
ncbi:MAG: hypothetical protein WKF37_19585 [Bryobacteraceae bacterium]